MFSSEFSCFLCLITVQKYNNEARNPLPEILSSSLLDYFISDCCLPPYTCSISQNLSFHFIPPSLGNLTHQINLVDSLHLQHYLLSLSLSSSRLIFPPIASTLPNSWSTSTSNNSAQTRLLILPSSRTLYFSC